MGNTIRSSKIAPSCWEMREIIDGQKILCTATPSNSTSVKPRNSHSDSVPNMTKRQGFKSRLNRSKTEEPKVKRLQFQCPPKTSDGPREEHVLFERLAIDFWQKTPNINVLDELVNVGNESMLIKLRDLLLAAIDRVKNDLNSKGVDLVPGGGINRIRLKVCNLPHAQLLLCSINKAFVEIIGRFLQE